MKASLALNDINMYNISYLVKCTTAIHSTKGL